MKQKVFVSAAIWGHEYVKAFVEFSLATQLSAGNIPALSKHYDVVCQIITTLDDKEWLEKQPLMQKLQRHATIQWDLIDHLCPEVLVPGEFSPGKYEFLTSLQNFAMASAIGCDFLILNYADFIWADGSMPNLIAKFDTGIDSVLSFCLPVDHDGGVKEISALAKEQADKDGVITVAPRRAVKIALNNLHRETKIRFYDDPTFNTAPTYTLWRVENEGLIITAYHQTMLALRVKAYDPFYYNGVLANSLDGFYSAILGANSNNVHADNSDEIFIFSLYDTILDCSIGGKSPNNLKGYTRDDSLRHCIKSVPESQRRFAFHPIEVRLTHDKPELWEKTKAFSRDALEKLHRETPFDYNAYNMFYVGGYLLGFKSLFTARAARHISNKKPFLYDAKRAWKRFIRNCAAFFATHFIPRNIALNGNFDRWRSQDLEYAGGIWLNLPSRNWIGHFDGGVKGHYRQSALVPNNDSRFSLMLEGGKGGSTANFGQRIKASALYHIRQRNNMTCSGYVRKEGSNETNIYVYLLVPDKRDNFTSYAHIQNIFNGFKIEHNNKWQYFESLSIDLGWIEHFPHGAMLYFAASGLNSPEDKLYFSQIKFEAGYGADAFKPRPVWQDWLLGNAYIPALTCLTNALKLLMHGNIGMSSIAYDPFVQTAIKPLVFQPLQRSVLFGASDRRIDLHKAIMLLYHARTEQNVANIKQFMPTIPLANGDAVDARTACYLWLGILPERLAKDVKNMHLLARLQKVAEDTLRMFISLAPTYAEGYRALGRNLWLQGRIDECFAQFKHAESLTSLSASSDKLRIMGLSAYPDLIIKNKLLSNDSRDYYVMASEDEVLNNEFFTQNQAFFDYWKPYFHFDFPKEYARTSTAQNTATIIAPRDAVAIQNQWANERRAPLLRLLPKHQQLLEQHKAIWGMKADDWFVCLEVHSVGDARCAPQDYRYTPIEDYYDTIKAVIAAGGWVVRMGDTSMIKLRLEDSGIDSSKVIDYAYYAEASLELEVALCASCKLFISASARLRVVAHAFERPVVSVNCPLYAGFAWHPDETFVPMLYYSLLDHRIIPVEELLSADLAHSDHNQYLSNGRIALLRNTPDDIAESVMEALQPHMPKTSEATAEFTRINQQFGRGISSRIAAYFAAKYREKLFKPQPAQEAHVA